MSTTPVYDLMLSGVTEEFLRKVLTVLIEHAGERVTRPQFVFEVFGVICTQGTLSNSKEDRQIRDAIEQLQQREYPILSSSGAAGYILAIDDSELDAYVAEIVTRQNSLAEKATALRKSRRWIGIIREYKTNKPAVQARLL